MKLFAPTLLLAVSFTFARFVFAAEFIEDVEEMTGPPTNPCIYCHFLYKDCRSVSLG